MIQVNMKRMFFDRAGVMAVVDRETQRLLATAGFKVMKNARQSIRDVGKKGNASKPGRPPKNRTGLLKNHIYFAYDPSRKGVVIGPEYRRLNQKTMAPVNQPGASMLEHGGQVRVKELWTGRKWVLANWKNRQRYPKAQTRTQTYPVAPRPYMQPALDKYLRREHAKNLKNLLRKGV